jgi:hypothetical protein
MLLRFSVAILFVLLLVLPFFRDVSPGLIAQAQPACTDLTAASFTGPSTSGAQAAIKAGALEVIGQSFTPTQSVTLTRASLSIANSGASVPITLTVNTDVGGTPGTQLASATAIPPTSTGTWVEFTFSSSPLLGAGASYLLVATTTESSGAYQWAAAFLASGDPYPGGKRYRPGHGDSWDHYDQLFQVSGCPAGDPTPTPQLSCTPVMAASYGSSESDGNTRLDVTYGQGTVGQSFTPTQSVILTRASILHSGAGALLTATIHAASGGAPGAELARRSVHTTSSSYTFVDFTFGPGVMLEAGQTYFLLISTLNQGVTFWRANSANPYPGGTTYAPSYQVPPGFPWSAWDQLFQVWGCPTGSATPSATPTPSPTGIPTHTGTVTSTITPTMSQTPSLSATQSMTATRTATPTTSSANALVRDTFSRSVTTGWGNPEQGGPQWYLRYIVGVTAVDASSGASVSGGRGRASVSTSGQSRYFAAVAGPSSASDYEVLATLNSGPTGSLVGVLGRSTATGVYLAWMSTGQNGIRLTTGAVPGPLGTGTLSGPVQPNTDYTMRFQLQGTSLRARAWQTGTPEPSIWQVTATDNHVAAGLAGVMVGFSNTGSGTFSFDDIRVVPLGSEPVTPSPTPIPTLTQVPGASCS